MTIVSASGTSVHDIWLIQRAVFSASSSAKVSWMWARMVISLIASMLVIAKPGLDVSSCVNFSTAFAFKSAFSTSAPRVSSFSGSGSVVSSSFSGSWVASAVVVALGVGVPG